MVPDKSVDFSKRVLNLVAWQALPTRKKGEALVLKNQR